MKSVFLLHSKIPNGHKYHQEYFLTELRRAIYPMQLTPFCWRTERTRAQFFVDEYSVAAALSEADRTIEQPNGSKIEIVVEDYEPYFQLDDQLREKMANAMRNRYDTKKNSLDLSKFYAHEQLRNHYCPLNRPLLMRTAIEIIENSVPDLEELILNDNRIRALNYMSDFNLGERLPKLRALFLAKNLVSVWLLAEFSSLQRSFRFSWNLPTLCNSSTKRILWNCRWRAPHSGKTTKRLSFTSGANDGNERIFDSKTNFILTFPFTVKFVNAFRSCDKW